MATVGTLGAAVLVALAVAAPSLSGPFTSPVFWLLLGLTVLTETAPLRIPMGDDEVDLTISTTFAFATTLLLGPLAGAATLITAAVVADVAERKAPWKLVFNPAQYTLAIAAASIVIDATGTWFAGGDDVTLATVLSAMAAGGAFALTNFLLITGVVAAAGYQRRGWSVQRALRSAFTSDVRLTAWSSAILVSLAPIVALAALASVWAIPLFIVPIVAVYQSVAIYLDRERHALRDRLTGLPNRALFDDRVRQAALRAQDTGALMAVLILNVDAFKEINAQMGYEAGDRILQRLASRLEVLLRDTDTLARLAADEFGIVLADVEDTASADRAVVALRGAVVRPFALPGGDIAVEASVGGVFSPTFGSEPRELVAAADRAMGQAKRYRLGHQWYAPQRDEGSGRMRMLAELRVAIDEGQLELHYQPKAALPSGRISGLEALVRWRRPNGELVSPGSFLPVAEDTGLIRDMTRYVVAAAVAQLRTWQDAGTPTEVAVNISARDLQDASLPDFVVEQLELHDVPAHCLQLEITEASIMVDVDKAVEILDRLHKIGVGLAIDDFGTGNTSLSKLPLLPVDVLKIDRSFVERLEEAPDDLIVRTTIDLSRGFGFQVVAEGVSSAVIYDRVVVLGVDYAQGFHLWRPLPVAEVGILLSAGSTGGS